MSNQTHSSPQADLRRSYCEEIGAYDALPANLKSKVMYAPFTISSKTVYTLWKMLGEEKTIMAIEQMLEHMRNEK